VEAEINKLNEENNDLNAKNQDLYKDIVARYRVDEQPRKLTDNCTQLDNNRKTIKWLDARLKELQAPHLTSKCKLIIILIE
jgi:hypothetical protein